MPGAYLWGWDGSDWAKVLVDASGHLQVDTLSSALPTGAATAANQVTTHGYIDGIETLLGAGLPVALDSLSLKVKEQSPITGFATSAKQDTIIGHVDGIEGLLAGGLPSALDTDSLKVREQNWPTTYPLSAAQIASLQQVTEQGTPSVHLYGYDGSAWQTLLVESSTYKNLRVKLYDGANPVTTDLLNANLITRANERGPWTHCQPWVVISSTQAKAVKAASYIGDGETLDTSLPVGLYGYNGSTWDRLRQGTPADAFTTPTYALQVMSFLMGYDGTDWNMVRVNTSGQLQTSEQFGGNVYSKTMTMTDDNATRFETSEKKLRDVVIIVKTNPMLLGETGVEVYPVGANEAVGFTKVDISTLYFKNAGAGNNGVITILGTEE